MSAEEVLLKFLGKPGYKPMRLEAIVQPSAARAKTCAA